MGRSRGGFSTKIHILVETQGKPVKFLLSPGQEADISYAQEMMTDQEAANFIGDKGYDSGVFVQWLEEQGIRAVIPPKSSWNHPRDYDAELYKERNLVERFINKIKWFRRIFARFEKLAARYLALLHWVGAIIWLR